MKNNLILPQPDSNFGKKIILNFQLEKKEKNGEIINCSSRNPENEIKGMDQSSKNQVWNILERFEACYNKLKSRTLTTNALLQDKWDWHTQT